MGVREAKASFSRLVNDAQRGREWTITQRGRPVAKIVPFENPSAAPLAGRLLRLEQSGVIEPPAARILPVPPALPLKRGLAQYFLEHDRGK